MPDKKPAGRSSLWMSDLLLRLSLPEPPCPPAGFFFCSGQGGGGAALWIDKTRSLTHINDMIISARRSMMTTVLALSTTVRAAGFGFLPAVVARIPAS